MRKVAWLHGTVNRLQFTQMRMGGEQALAQHLEQTDQSGLVAKGYVVNSVEGCSVNSCCGKDVGLDNVRHVAKIAAG